MSTQPDSEFTSTLSEDEKEVLSQASDICRRLERETGTPTYIGSASRFANGNSRAWIG